jgi:hypothetical protein
LETQRQRAEQAEAANARVRRFCTMVVNGSIRVQAQEQALDTLKILDGKEADEVVKVTEPLGYVLVRDEAAGLWPQDEVYETRHEAVERRDWESRAAEAAGVPIVWLAAALIDVERPERVATPPPPGRVADLAAQPLAPYYGSEETDHGA